MNSIQTFSSTEFGYTIALNDPPLPHVGPIVEAFRTLFRRPGSKLNLPEPWPTSAARQRVLLNLSDRASRRINEARIEFLVEEGLWLYRLGSRASGWGCVEAGVQRARVMVVRVREDSHYGEVLAEAEIRISLARPWRNATQIGNAAASLVREGCLSRSAGKPIPLRHLSVPKLTLQDRFYWAWRHFAPSLWDSVAWRFGFAPRLQWTIGILPALAVQSAWQFPWKRVTWLKAPEKGIIADPFLVNEGGKHWLFYERMLFNESKGTLWAGQIDPHTGKLSAEREILNSPHHLSFPNVFKVDQHWYMLPEQGQSGGTKLYRATNFPYIWEEYCDLLPNFPGIDPVLHQHDGKWWLFVTRDAAPCVDNNLHLFSSDTLDGDFSPHPMNPIKSGLFGSRMAGPIYKQGDSFIRPAQDGRRGYGYGVVLYKIQTLTVDSYDEQEMAAWQPERDGKFSHGFHAFHICGDHLVIDGQQLTYNSPKWYQHAAWLYTSPEIYDGPLFTIAPIIAGA